MNRATLLANIPIIILSCIFVALILGVMFAWPKFQEIREIQKEVKEKEARIQYEENYFSELRTTKIELEKYKTELAKISSALPSGVDFSVPSLFNFIQKAVSQSGLVLKSISSFTSSGGTGTANVKNIQFSVQVSGPYSSFKNFLSILEKSARMIEVENISFSGKGGAGSLDFGLKIKASSY